MKLLYVFLLCFPLFTTNSNSVFDSFKDQRDGQTYQTIQIGQQTWMAENLNFRSEASICYDNHPFNCRRYGRLYVWEEAIKLCPSGWRLPNDKDWNALYRKMGNSPTAYRSLIQGGQSGFEAKLAGWLTQAENFQHVGERAYFWSATENDEDYASYYRLDIESRHFTRTNSLKSLGFSCRCIKAG